MYINDKSLYNIVVLRQLNRKLNKQQTEKMRVAAVLCLVSVLFAVAQS